MRRFTTASLPYTSCCGKGRLSYVSKTLRGEEVSKIEKVVNLALEKVQIEDLYYNFLFQNLST